MGNINGISDVLVLASTWDTALAGRYGWAISQEVKAKDRNVILGPCININRVPQGEKISKATVRIRSDISHCCFVRPGVQSGNVAATVKHYATNNQEWERGTIK